MRKVTLIVAAVLLLAASASASSICTLSSSVSTACQIGIFDITFSPYTPPAGAAAASAITVTHNITGTTLSLTFTAPNTNPFRSIGTAGTPVVYTINYTVTGPTAPWFSFTNQNDSLVKLAATTGTYSATMALTADGKTSTITCATSGCTPTGTPRTYGNAPQTLIASNVLTMSATGTGSKVQLNNLRDSFGFKVPEPGTIGFLVSGLLGLGLLARRRRA